MENKNFNVDEFFTQKLEEVKKEELPVSEKPKKKKKGIIIGVIAGVMAAVTIVTAALWPKKNNNKGNNEPTKPSIIQEDPVKVDDLGLTYEEPTNENTNSQYGNTTGDINKDDLVEKDGVIWKDKDAADKSDDVGKTEIDDKDGQYEVKPDGTVHDKEQGYEVKDEDGNTKEEGSNENGIPDGYAWDEVLGKIVPENEVGKYVYADATYYAPDGTVILEKGDIVLKETLEKAKKQFTTTKPQQSETQPTEPETKPTEPETQPTEPETKPEETVTTEEGVINKDGTYTIYGVTYKTKEDYHQFLLHPEQYGYYNGMVLSLEDIEALFNQNQKTK